MPRWDYDVVFYRVFCVTLLGIAFTFTVILTNVFIDIDGLLTNKQGKHKTTTVVTTQIDDFPEEFTPEPIDGDDTSYGDNDDNYRTKRSIETQNFLFHIKNPKIKNILTNRLETLLEALDAEEPSQNVKTENNTEQNEIKEVPREEMVAVDESKLQEEKIKRQKDEDMLHLTMHNILLQGITGHMDLGEVYKRVNSMMKNLDQVRTNEKAAHQKLEEKSLKSQSEETKSVLKPSLDERFVSELIRCNDLQDQILSGAMQKVKKQSNLNMQSGSPIDYIETGRNGPGDRSTPRIVTESDLQRGADIAINTKLGPNIFIKTTVDIKSIGSDPNDTISNENIRGIIELIFNGKSIKFTKPDEDQPISQKNTVFNINQPKITKTMVNNIPTERTAQTIQVDAFKNVPNNYINSFISEYFKHFPTENKYLTEEIKESIETKRLKRHVKIKFNKEKKAAHFLRQEKPNIEKKPEDDELYVEIETHFDSKGMKGEKKKKLIRSLIDKIQKAIHSEETKQVEHESKKAKHKPLHVRKRFQNPLEHKELSISNKYMVPISNIVHRQLNPIVFPRTIPSDDTGAPKVRDRTDEAWKKEFIGPTFLTATKSINSAEMSEVEVDYNRVFDINGIPQRLQKPLNTDTADEKEKPNSYFDLGNMKFFIKDVDGSGFSVGFNQYVDEPPDPETMKLFTGLENVIKTYHQNIDEIQEEPPFENVDFHEEPEAIPIKNDHIIVRRSVNHKRDYHTNEYKIIYDGNFLPYNDYKDIYERENSKANMEYRPSQYRESPLIVDEHIFDKNLKPAEIFGLANLFRRKKRSLKVKKISNLKSKIKLNRFLNTKAISKKIIYLNKKRHKRQISKIRIIASDLPFKRSSDANFFLVSGENLFADRAIVKDDAEPEPEAEKIGDSEYTPYQSEESMSPYREFESKSRKNNLMSKYPHIFMEEISRSREDLSPGHTLLFGKIPAYRKHMSSIDDVESENINDEFLSDTSNRTQPEFSATTETAERIQGVEDIVNALQSPKTNYKVTLKVTPKNMSLDINPGFKEIHTSINKRYNKNGLVYTSLVNVSEISKITNLNKTKPPPYSTTDMFLAKKVKDQHDRIQILLKQHQKNINEQLAKLSEEKSNIESILIDENNTVAPNFDYIDVVMPSKPRKGLIMSKDEVKRMAEAVFNVKEEPTISATEATTVRTVTSATMTSPSTTEISTTPTTITSLSTTTSTTYAPTATTQRSSTVTTTRPPPVSFFTEKLKKNLLHTIERNEKLTDQILRKIDKNTEILQTFLKKFTTSIENQKLEHRTTTSIKEEKTEKPLSRSDHNHPFSVDWRQHGIVPFNPNAFRKNGSQIAIPFLYAYQHPIMPLKNNSPVASVVYHGTIHTNSIHAKNFSAEKDKFPPIHKSNPNNQTRFFLDEVENDYKVIPINNIDKTKLGKNMTTTI